MTQKFNEVGRTRINNQSTILENIDRKEQALKGLREHCLCARIEGNIVFLPPGYQVGGVRFEMSAKGMEAALVVLERLWQESFP